MTLLMKTAGHFLNMKFNQFYDFITVSVYERSS